VQEFIIYRRVSTEEQGNSGLGLKAQKRDIDLFLSAYAETPFTVIAEFEDIESGRNNDRPELAKALELCRKTKATLLVSKLDRLSRRVSQIALLMEDRHIRFRVASMPHAENFQLHLFASLAEQEREFISLRTKAALAEAKAKGVKLGGIRPKTEARNMAIQEAAQGRALRVADLIRPLRDQGKTLREIADALNLNKVPTARGGSWAASQVKRVMDRLDAAGNVEA
jgi:DNA invertase Pin-like site-specific DNA recombinase